MVSRRILLAMSTGIGAASVMYTWTIHSLLVLYSKYYRSSAILVAIWQKPISVLYTPAILMYSYNCHFMEVT